MRANIVSTIAFIISAWFSVAMFLITDIFRLMITADSPPNYTHGEGRFFLLLCILTTGTITITVLSAKKYILQFTLILTVIMILFSVRLLRSYIYFGPENIDLVIDWSMPIIFLIPSAVGFVVYLIKKRWVTHRDWTSN